MAHQMCFFDHKVYNQNVRCRIKSGMTGDGFRFIHKKIYNAILRVDYGFNLWTPEVNGFVLGLGQCF